MYLKKLKIGDVELENNILLAPMAGITDLPFRKIAKKHGVGLVYTEMVSSKAIFHNDEKTKKLLNVEGEKRPIAVQIFGSDVESMVYAAKYVEPIADIIDINMGCPAPKVVKNGDGSKLLLNLDLAEEIVRRVVGAVKKPVTVKLRKGWNSSNIVAVEAAKRFESAGAKAITIHGRTREEYYSGTCDLEIIRQVKDAVNIPVIGNGDIRDLKSAIEYGEGQLETRINLVMDNSIDESEQIAVIDNGYYLIQFKDSIPNKEIKEANESKIVGNITIPKGSYIIEHYVQGELIERRFFSRLYTAS